ncbi:Epoxide hydrolase 4 [Armadillidium nasatum]|uniref:Epoxide hydrolase 4 n=1 Tax=Armadillidium nasatum TaxID=96803 RepID=A0A5N5SYL1_9CRUS|nr:Epoxide hydrolase 4 [Armadillidium nasatum]
MLLLHGFPECWLSWRHQLKEFSTNYCSIGLSVSVSSSRTVIVGHDWGSIIAWKTVQTYPDLFEKHINLNGPPIEVMSSMLRSSFKQFKMSW